MKKLLTKNNFILIYLTCITGIYPALLTPDRIQALFSLERTLAVLLHYSAVFVFFFLTPALILKLYYHDSLKDYGLNFRNIPQGGKLILLLLPVLVLALYFSAKDPAFTAEYPLAKSIKSSLMLFIIMEFFYLLYYIGWEFLFRGFTVLGLTKNKKNFLFYSLAIQTIASTLLHYTKPAGEIYLAIIAGFILGYYVYRYQTIWFAVCIHWLVGLTLDSFIILRNP